MNPSPFLRLLGSSKAWVMVAAIAGAVVLSLVKGSGVSANDALGFIKWVVAAYMAATGLEDAAQKSASSSTTNTNINVPPSSPPVDPDRIAKLFVRDLQRFNVRGGRIGACLTPRGVAIAVVNRATRATNSQVQTMVYACSLQLTEHCAPLWNRSAPTMTFYADPGLVPEDAYLIAIVDSPDLDGALGYHTEIATGAVDGFVFVAPVLDNGGVMLYDPANPQTVSVSSVLSHEAMEAFIDPFVNLYADGPLLPQGSSYAVEVGDPVEGDSYAMDTNGQMVSVSNFATPHWFDADAPQGAKFDYLSKLTAPVTMTPGGYMVVRSTPGTEAQIFGERMPDWKRKLKAMKLGHGGVKSSK
jgi:hypothetical protein